MSRGSAALLVALTVVVLGVAACAGGSPRAASGSPAAPAAQGSSAPAGSAGSPASSHSLTLRLLQFARCMRTHGVPGFADPQTPGSAASHPPGSSSYLGNSFNPNTPVVRAADRACHKYADASPVTAAGAAKVLAEQLRYARCIRAHGEPDFPDPSPDGGFTVPSSVDEDSPVFQAAENACKNLQPGADGPPGT